MALSEAVNATLGSIIRLAYGLKEFQTAGEPEWVATLNETLATGPFRFNWNLRYVDATSEMDEYWAGRTAYPTFNGIPATPIVMS